MLVSLALLGVTLLSPGTANSDRIAAPPERAYAAFADDRSRRFDFWIGEWDVDLRIRQDDGTWLDAVEAKASIYSILGGEAILELWDSERLVGFSLRYFDEIENSWVLWLDWPGPNRSRLSRFTGGFRHGRGEFTAVHPGSEGGTVTSVYTFADITPFSLRWDDAHSADGGTTWSRNWIMEFDRSAVDPIWPIRRTRVPTDRDGSRCPDERFRHYEMLVGDWRGDGTELDVYPVLDGCAVIGFLEAPDTDAFLFATYDTVEERWETAVLDAAPRSQLVRYVGAEAFYDLASEAGEELTWTLSGAPRISGNEGDVLVLRRGDRRWTFERIGGGPGRGPGSSQGSR